MSQIPADCPEAPRHPSIGTRHCAPPLRLTGDDGAVLEIHPQGAHLSLWVPAGESANRLFLSRRSEYRSGAAIRGGVPVIFPQFAAEGPLPRHGFARTALWQLQAAQGASARFALADSAATQAIWPHAFHATLDLSARGRELQMTLAVHNRGDAPLRFTAALHTYLAVDDIGEAVVTGLQGLRYRDSAQGNAAGVDDAAELRFPGEIDRIYFDAPETLRLLETRRALTIRQQGFRDTVVWNPGATKAAALADLEPGGERRMLCIEAATIGDPEVLAAGERWSGTQGLISE